MISSAGWLPKAAARRPVAPARPLVPPPGSFRRLRFGGDLGVRRPGWRAAERRRQSIEPIALAGHGGDEPRRLGIGFDLAPQATDQRVGAAVEQFERPVGDGLEDGVAAQDASGPADEQAQKPKFAAGERNGFTRFTRKRAGAEIEDEPRKADPRHRFAQRGRLGVQPFLRNALHLRAPRRWESAEWYPLKAENYKGVT